MEVQCTDLFTTCRRVCNYLLVFALNSEHPCLALGKVRKVLLLFPHVLGDTACFVTQR